MAGIISFVRLTARINMKTKQHLETERTGIINSLVGMLDIQTKKKCCTSIGLDKARIESVYRAGCGG